MGFVRAACGVREYLCCKALVWGCTAISQGFIKRQDVRIYP